MGTFLKDRWTEPDPSELTRRDFRNAGLLCLLATILFADVLFFGANFFHRDLLRYFFPMKRVVREVIGNGEFPFWNRYLSAGQPMAANPAYEVFYPPQWLIFIGSYRFGFALHIVVHVFFALIGAYLLPRALKTRESVALFGAISFGLSGFLLGSMTTLSVFFVWSWAPLLGWAFVRLLSDPSPRRFAIAAIIAATQMLAGEPVSLLQVWALVGCAALLAPDRRRSLTIGAGLFVATLAIAAVQIVPSIDHARDSVRSRGFSYDQVVDYGMPLVRPLEMIVPRLFAMLDIRKQLVWDADAFSRHTPYFLSLYVGVAIVVLAVAGIVTAARGSGALLAICGVSYLLAIGGKTPLYGLLYRAGIARSLRYPEKFAAAAVFSILIFGAVVAERFLAGDVRVRRAVRWCSAAAVLTCAGVLALWRFPPHGRTLIPTAHRYWLFGLGLTVIWAALAFTVRHADTRPWKLVAFLVLLCDVVMLGREASPSLPGDFFTPPAVVKSLDANHDDYAVFNRGDWQASDANRRTHGSVPRWWTVRNSLQPMTSPAWGIRSVLELDYDETDLLPTHDLLDLMMLAGNSDYASWAEPFMLRSNARYVLDFRPREEDLAESHGDLALSRPVSVTPFRDLGRYYFATELIRATSRVEILNAFVKTRATLVPFPAFRPADGRVIAMRESSNAATIDVDASGEAFLVVAVTRHKYWRATIDGRDAPLVPANVAYQGLTVPAGRHRIQMRYRNPIVIWSGAASLLALMAAIGALVFGREGGPVDDSFISAAPSTTLPSLGAGPIVSR